MFLEQRIELRLGEAAVRSLVAAGFNRQTSTRKTHLPAAEPLKEIEKSERSSEERHSIPYAGHGFRQPVPVPKEELFPRSKPSRHATKRRVGGIFRRSHQAEDISRRQARAQPAFQRGSSVEFQRSEVMLSVAFSGGSTRSERANGFRRRERPDGCLTECRERDGRNFAPGGDLSK